MSKSILSLVKAGKILEMFLDDEKSLGITEFSRALEMPKATVQNLVSTLEDMGYIEKDPMTMKYRLGPVLFQLGMKYAHSMDLTMIARVWLEKLCTQYGEMSQAGIMMGDKLTVVMKVEADSNYMVFPQPGSVIPVHSSSLGKVLLAFMPEPRRDRVLAGCEFVKFTEKTITGRDEFLDELDRVKKTGVGFDTEETVSGLSCIAGPVFNNNGDCIAAVSLSGNAFRIESKREEIINAVKYVGSRISEQMGYRAGVKSPGSRKGAAKD